MLSTLYTLRLDYYHNIAYITSMEQNILIFKAETPKAVVTEARQKYAEYLVASVPTDGTPGERLRSLRLAARLTLAEVGERTGCKMQRVSDWERGYRQISKESARRLADAFGVSAAVFL